MPKVELPGGHYAVIGLKMADYRELWSAGAVKQLQSMTEDAGDLGASYPLLAKTVRSWDLVDEAGNALDPADVKSFDELEPGTFMRLLGAVSEFISGSDSKN